MRRTNFVAVGEMSQQKCVLAAKIA